MSEFKKINGFRDYCTETDCHKIIKITDNPVELLNYHISDRLFCDGGCFQMWIMEEQDEMIREVK